MLDVNGVLVEGRPQDGQPWHCDLEADLGISVQELTNAFFVTHWESIVLGAQDLLPVLSEILPSVAPNVSSMKLVDYWFAMDSRINEHVLADVRSARSSGVPVYLATNQDHMRAEYLMTQLNLGSKVDGMVYSAKTRYKKPQREFFRHAQICFGYKRKPLRLIDETLSNLAAVRGEGWGAFHWDGSANLAEIIHDRELLGREKGLKYENDTC